MIAFLIKKTIFPQHIFFLGGGQNSAKIKDITLSANFIYL